METLKRATQLSWDTMCLVLNAFIARMKTIQCANILKKPTFSLEDLQNTFLPHESYNPMKGTPTNTVIAADSYAANYVGDDASCLQRLSKNASSFGLPSFRHKESGNFVFVDGHAANLNQNVFVASGTSAAGTFMSSGTQWTPFVKQYYTTGEELVN